MYLGSGLHPSAKGIVLSSASCAGCQKTTTLCSLCLWCRTPQWKSNCLCLSGLLERVAGWWVCAGLITQPLAASTAFGCAASTSLAAPASRGSCCASAVCHRLRPAVCACCCCVGGAGGCPELADEGGSFGGLLFLLEAFIEICSI